MAFERRVAGGGLMAVASLPLETLPPADTDAEAICLAIFLSELDRGKDWQGVCTSMLGVLEPLDFHWVRHRQLYEIIERCHAEGKAATIEDARGVVKGEDWQYAVSLTTAYAGLFTGLGYAHRVHDAGVKRRAIAALSEGVRLLYEPNGNTQAALEESRSLLELATSGVHWHTGLFTVADLEEDIDDLYENGSARGVSPGWPSVDNLYRVAPGEWTLVTGIPSHGKSAWVDALMVNLAKREKWCFAVCSPENQPIARHFAKLARLYIGKAFDRNKMEVRMSKDDLEQAKGFVDRYFTFVLPTESQRTVAGVLATMEAAMQKKPVQGIVIDPWNELDHSRPENQTETEFISSSLTRLRQFARRHQVHIWLVAHPAKIQRPPGEAPYPVPRPYDVSGSAHWFNKSDNAIAIYREDDTNNVQVHVQKIRFDQNGKKGVTVLRYSAVTGQYTDFGGTA